MKATLNSRDQSAFTLTELMIVIAVIGLLAALALPNLAKARDNSRLNTIYSNLRTLEGAKDQWALDNNKANGTPVADTGILTNYFRFGALPAVVHETYVPNPIGESAEADLPPAVQIGPYAPGAIIPGDPTLRPN